MGASNHSRSQTDPRPMWPRCYPRPWPPDLGGGARSNGGETTGVQPYGATTTHSLPRVALHKGNDIANCMGSYSPGIGAARARILGNGGRGEGGNSDDESTRQQLPTDEIAWLSTSRARQHAPEYMPEAQRWWRSGLLGCGSPFFSGWRWRLGFRAMAWRVYGAMATGLRGGVGPPL
jgi:hypothetical protein